MANPEFEAKKATVKSKEAAMDAIEDIVFGSVRFILASHYHIF